MTETLLVSPERSCRWPARLRNEHRTVAPPQSPGLIIGWRCMSSHGIVGMNADTALLKGPISALRLPPIAMARLFLRRRRCWGIDQPDALMKPGWGFGAAVLRRFWRNTPRLTFFIERSPRPWRCGRSPSSPRNCRNNARIRARELKPPLQGCACLAAANRSCTKETAQGGSAKRSNSTLGSSAANRAVTCWLSR